MYIENCNLLPKQVVLIARVVLILSGPYSGSSLYCVVMAETKIKKIHAIHYFAAVLLEK